MDLRRGPGGGATAETGAAKVGTISSPPGGTPRIPGIDGLRATAILIVMASHAGLGRVIPGGFGVTVFFFLSGYLITTLLRLERERHGRIDLAAFYYRRALRILPPLYLTLALVAGLAAAGLTDEPMHASGTALDALFLTNYADLLGVSSTTPIPLWSLDVEEHFYLLFPILFIALAASRVRRALAVLVAICGAVLLLRVASFAMGWREHIPYWSHTRIDSIILGATLALWQNPVLDRHAWRPTGSQVALAAGVILLTLAVRGPFFRETIRYPLQGAALFVMFSAAIQARGVAADLLNARPLRLVALLSYTLYLVHFPLLMATERMPVPFGIIVAYLLAFAWAGGLHLLIERPLARWRKRSLQRALAGGA